MTDQWDGWPDDELGDGDTADLGGGLDQPDLADNIGGGLAFDPLSESADDADAGEPVAPPPAGDPAIGYGEEPLDTPEPDDAEPTADPPADDDAAAADGVVGFGPAEAGDTDGGDAEQPAGEGVFGPADPPVGADPDLDPYGDEPADAVFPEPLDPAIAPEPVDGYPWADAQLIGGDDAEPLPDPATQVAAAPPAADLYAYAAEDAPAGAEPGWAALQASPDPATSTLARFWA